MLTIASFKKFLFLSFIIVCYFFRISYAQDFTLIAKIDTAAKFATVDNLGNIYLVNPKNEVLKYNKKGKLLWNYTQNSFGNISEIDVTDPLRVVLFYQDMQQMVVLNNTLNEISRYSFTDNVSNFISTIATANNNGFWVYDQINRQLKKLTNNFIDDINTGNIYQRDDINASVNYMIFENNYLYLNDVNKAIHIFDGYGNYYKTALVKTPQYFSVAGNNLFYLEGNFLIRYNFLTFKTDKYALPIQNLACNIFLKNEHLIILTEKGLSLWFVNGALYENN